MTVWDDLVGQHHTVEAAADGGGWTRHEPRLAVHRPARVGPIQRRHRLRRGPAVPARRSRGLRRLPAVPHRPRRLAPRRHHRPHRTAVARCQGGPRPRPAVGDATGRDRLADHRRRGRRPAHRAGVQRPAQGDRGADAADGLDALRADRSRTCCRPSVSRCRLVTLTTPTAEDVAAFLVRADGVEPGLAAYCRARQPGPHRPRPGAGPRRVDPQPASRDRRLPRQAHHPRRLPDRRVQHGRGRQGGGRDDHRRARRPREDGPRRLLRRRRARPPAP